MFTGITQGLYPVHSVMKKDDLLFYTIIFSKELLRHLKYGASVAIDGCCQTVVSIKGDLVSFEAMSETLSKTTLGDLAPNKIVSVERSVRFGDEIGGHEVSGHVFETGIIIERKRLNNSVHLTIRCSERCLSYIKPKGFIAVNGSSLTIGAVHNEQKSFEVYLIPETLRVTNFANKDIGDQVNLEPEMKTMILVESTKNNFSDIYTRLEKIEDMLKERKE